MHRIFKHWLVAACLLAPSTAFAQATLDTPTGNLQSFGNNGSAHFDVSTDFGTGLEFGGTTYTGVWVDENGLLALGASDDTFPDGADGDVDSEVWDADEHWLNGSFGSGAFASIAPFWANTYPTNSGDIYVYQADGIFRVTWIDVAPFEVTDNGRQNSFQVTLTDRSDVNDGDFDVVFKYSECTWALDESTTDGGGNPTQLAKMGLEPIGQANYAYAGDIDPAGGGGLCDDSNIEDTGVFGWSIRDGVISTYDVDQCPGDPDKTVPGECGCGVEDSPENLDDTDMDQVPACLDACPGNGTKWEDEGVCGCDIDDTPENVDNTGDDDDVPFCLDACPTDSDKWEDEGICGCGVFDDNLDGDELWYCAGDAVPNVGDEDVCPEDSDKWDDEGVCGCGVRDDDDDGDGVWYCEGEDVLPNDGADLEDENPDPNNGGSLECYDLDGDGCDDCSQLDKAGVDAPSQSLDGPDKDEDGICNDGDDDDDGDGYPDTLDSQSLNPFICADTDDDGCDDCSAGSFDPNNDGCGDGSGGAGGSGGTGGTAAGGTASGGTAAGGTAAGGTAAGGTAAGGTASGGTAATGGADSMGGGGSGGEPTVGGAGSGGQPATGGGGSGGRPGTGGIGGEGGESGMAGSGAAGMPDIEIDAGPTDAGMTDAGPEAGVEPEPMATDTDTDTDTAEPEPTPEPEPTDTDTAEPEPTPEPEPTDTDTDTSEPEPTPEPEPAAVMDAGADAGDAGDGGSSSDDCSCRTVGGGAPAQAPWSLLALSGLGIALLRRRSRR